MKTLKFKTNINCGGCVSNVTSSLNLTAGEGHWQVDTQDPNKILTITSDEVSEKEIIEALKKAGYSAEPVA